MLRRKRKKNRCLRSLPKIGRDMKLKIEMNVLFDMTGETSERVLKRKGKKNTQPVF